jgi:hypothetical protein
MITPRRRRELVDILKKIRRPSEQLLEQLRNELTFAELVEVLKIASQFNPIEVGKLMVKL